MNDASPAPAGRDALAPTAACTDAHDLRLERKSWNDFRSHLATDQARAVFDTLWERVGRHARAIRNGHGAQDDYVHAALLAMLLEAALEVRALRIEVDLLRNQTHLRDL